MQTDDDGHEMRHNTETKQVQQATNSINCRGKFHLCFKGCCLYFIYKRATVLMRCDAPRSIYRKEEAHAISRRFAKLPKLSG